MPPTNWKLTRKRMGIACFESRNPSDRTGDGDAFEEFDTPEKAYLGAEKILLAGRFQLLVIWDGRDGQWQVLDELTAETI